MNSVRDVAITCTAVCVVLVVVGEVKFVSPTL